MGFITNSFQLSGNTYTSTVITGITSGDSALSNTDSNLITERAVKYYVDNNTAAATGITSLSTAISTEASTRGAADTSLSTAISSETSSRLLIYNALSTSISSEASTRGSADTSLSTAISTRVSVDTSLSTAVSTANSVRASADTSLSTAIAGAGGVSIINNFNNYVVTATGTANTLQGEGNLRFTGTVLTLTGNMVTSNGSATTPAYAFAGDPDTGFFYAATSSIGVSTNGIENFRFTSTGDFLANTDIIAYSSTVSDIRLKNIKSYLDDEDVLDIIKNLKTIKYEWKHKDDGVHIGFIAQDMEKYVPEIVKEHNMLFSKNDELYKAIRYEEFIPYLTTAIKKQQEIIENQQKDIDELKKIILKNK